MVTRQKPAHLTQEEFDEIEREESLYAEMLEQHHGEWFAIIDGRLFRSREVVDVVAALRNEGLYGKDVLIQFIGTPPLRICEH